MCIILLCRELVSVTSLQLDDIYLRDELSTGYLPDYNGKHDSRKFQLPNLVQIWITSLGKDVYSIAASRDVIDQIDLLPPQVENTAPCGQSDCRNKNDPEKKVHGNMKEMMN